MDKRLELETLIHSLSKMRDRDCLSASGLEYLAGLEKAYGILFPNEIKG